MPTRLAIRIQESLDELTPSERTLASYILENQHLMVGLSAAELARQAGTSKSTTVRFFRTLGYESFEAVRLQARGELNRLQPGADLVANVARTSAGSPEAYLADEMTALARSHEGLSSETLKAMLDRLASADRVWVAAFGDDALVAPLVHGALSAVRNNVQLLSDGVTSTLNKLISMGPRDSLLLITLGERSADARFAVEQAKAAGATILVLANLSVSSPVGSDVVVRCHANSSLPEGSVVGAVSIMQFIARQLAVRLGTRAATRKALLEGIKEAARSRN
jgi:DNA-binding MurR/RpiR family transcriptional regulator